MSRTRRVLHWSAGLVLAVAGAGALQSHAEPVQEFTIVAQSGVAHFVYVSPSGLQDNNFVAQVLDAVTRRHGKGRAIQVMMFDDKQYTPHGFPMTDAQMKHQRAQYNYNPNTNYERFVWLTVANPSSSPPELKETEAKIRPGYTD